MANIIKHIRTGLKVREGDEVQTTRGTRKVLATSYSGRQGARIWTKHPHRVGDREVFAASECHCYVTSEDDA